MVAAVHLPQAVAQTTVVASLSPAAGFSPGPVPMDVLRAKAPEATNEIYCTGFCIIGGPVAYLSDGSSVTPDDGLQKIERNRVTITGRVYPVRKYKDVDTRRGYLDTSLSSSVFAAPSAPAFTSQTPPIPQAWTPLHPVNLAEILPAIHGQGGPPPPVVNGFGHMAGQSSQIGQTWQNF
jgi:hypothetical protein